MQVAEARRLLSEYGRLIEDNRSPSTGDHLPATIGEMDRAIRSVLTESLNSTAELDTLLFAYCELANWESPSGANPSGGALRHVRSRRFIEMAREAAATKQQGATQA